jgi:hypothetical protein
MRFIERSDRGPSDEPVPEEVGSRVPDGVEPIVAYRMWTAESDLLLHSGYDATWPAGEWMVAACAGPHTAPNERCTCGLYSLREPDSLHTWINILFALNSEPGAPAPTRGTEPSRPLEWPSPVVGKVHLAGKVIEHDDGYRAERARLVEILPVEPFRREHELIAQRYGVPVGSEIPIDPDLVPPGIGSGTTSAPGGNRGTFGIIGLAGLVLLFIAVACLAMFFFLLPAAIAIFMIAKGTQEILADHHVNSSGWWACGIVAAGGAILLGCVASLIRSGRSSDADTVARHLHHGTVCGNGLIEAALANQLAPSPAPAPVEPPIPDRPRPY